MNQQHFWNSVDSTLRELLVLAEDMDIHRSKMEEAARDKPRATLAPALAASEIEEFFVAMEGKLLQYYKDKYNYDFVEDEPMGGRYEWHQIEALKTE
ncbi:cyclin-dependent kinase inhibitor 1-like [Rhodamnia argentea]|uniref:Cyclin-dependent kinase inhibitor 1-like n=1 Tax=Rhodamnia argentea TaxID=178133 RepID=A0A8B8PVI1_9MYRT|nr:cyclin-dependent kinase inhibitor 1-like [Rhodamnia argentea]